MGKRSILIAGAGVAGLAAAGRLARAGFAVTVLEARDRAGGRIHTVVDRAGCIPIELGAEFLHGAKNSAWQMVRKARLPTHEVRDQHWLFIDGRLRQERRFWELLGEVNELVNPGGPDEDVESLLDRAQTLPPRVKWLAREYVEGFHAAPVSRLGVKALARADAAAEKDDGTRQFKISTGYAGLIAWLFSRAVQAGARVHFETALEVIRWKRGQVRVEARTAGDGTRRFEAERLIVALPLGVLKRRAAITFIPRLKEKQAAIRKLEVGHVTKLVLQFRSRFWPHKNFGFVHAPSEWFPTWWVDERGRLLTGWAGGPRAERSSRDEPEKLVSEALRALGLFFGIRPASLRELLEAHYFHEWSSDPWARGAYSYTPVDMAGAPGELAAPVAQTLFFAGEATDWKGEQGTVHGAIASGLRAAREASSKT
jgi:monoamine oxidase